MAVPRVHICGHSFVKRLKTFIRESDHFHFNFGFTDPVLIQYSGFSGATIDTLRQHLEELVDFEANVVVLVIGTVDIYQTTCAPSSIVNHLHQLILDIKRSVPSVENILVCQILHRTLPSIPTRFPVDLDWYNKRVDETNLLLSKRLPAIRQVCCKLCRCTGFWSPSAKASAFHRDGVHLSKEGNRKLYHILKAAVSTILRSSRS